MSIDDVPARPRRRSAGKASSQPDAKRVKLTLYLDDALAKRFAIHATMSGMDKSELFAEMVRRHCNRFVTSDRGKAPVDEEPSEPTP